MKKKNESKLNNLFRRNKTVFMLAFFFIFLGVGILATTTITNTNVNSPTGTYTNLSADSINEVLYVQAGNGSDIKRAIDACTTDGCEIILPEGNLTITTTINLDKDILLRGNGEATVIYPNGDFDVVHMNSTRSSVRDLKIDTSNVASYSSNAIVFDDDIRYGASREHLSNLYIDGTRNDTTGSSGILFKDDDGAGITWVKISDIEIEGFNYGILMNWRWR